MGITIIKINQTIQKLEINLEIIIIIKFVKDILKTIMVIIIAAYHVILKRILF